MGSLEAWLPRISHKSCASLFSWFSMGGFRSFFIESKLFQLVVEEGGNFYSLKIFEQGKYYMQSVFMGKSVAL